MPKIYFTADHAGFALKDVLVAYVRTLGYEVEDLGAFSLDPADDYPDFVTPLAQKIAENKPTDSSADGRGIIIGGSGQGEAMVANRVKGVRAAVFYGGSPEIIQRTREHNNANVLSIGARFVSENEAIDAVRLFLSTPFSDLPRHMRRLAKF